MALEVGSVIDGKYEVVGLLGEGGMGAVYEGRNVRIQRRVAIKVLHRTVAQKPEMVKRFEREATAAARIGSKHIVDVLDLGDLPNGDSFMVMEYLEGHSLATMIKGQTLGPEVILPWVSQLLKGLGAAHAANIVHRDLKPDNVFITQDGVDGADFVKVLDFGVSKFHALDEEEGNMTRTGAMMGTPYYMAPEQARGKGKIDHQTDIYAVGVLMFRAMAGVPPFDGENVQSLLFSIALEEPKKLPDLCPHIDREVVAIVEKAMERKKEDRYQSAADFREDIRNWMRARGLETSQATGTHDALTSGQVQRVLGATNPTPAGVDPMGTQPTIAGVASTSAESSKSSNLPAVLAAVAVVALVGAGALYFMPSTNAGQAAPGETATEEPAPEAEPASPETDEAPADEPAPSAETSATPDASTDEPEGAPEADPTATAAQPFPVPTRRPITPPSPTPPSPTMAPPPAPKGRQYTRDL